MFPAIGALFLTVLSCEAARVKFEPTPPVIARRNETVEMKCRHGDSSMNVMLWYQRTPGGGLRLIGYGYTGSKPTLEAEFRTRFGMTREEVRAGGLSISSVGEEDSAEYFCAASTR